VTETQAPPAHRTLAAELRWVRANLPGDTAQAVTRALDCAVARAETESDQARIWRGEAAQREAAVALVQVVRAELARAERTLPDPDGPGSLYAQGGAWVIAQLRAALEPDQAGQPAATLNGAL